MNLNFSKEWCIKAAKEETTIDGNIPLAISPELYEKMIEDQKEESPKKDN